MILELLRRHGVRGGRGAVFEFFGDGVATISTTGRATICNMVVETGATAGVFPADERDPPVARGAGPRSTSSRPLAADPGADVRRGRADRPGRAGAAGRAAAVAGQRRPGRRGGRHAARAGVRRVVGEQLLRGPRDGRRGPARPAASRPGVVLTVTPGLPADPRHDHPRPGSTATCSPRARGCWSRCAGRASGIGQAPVKAQPSLRTFNRNFPGRSGTVDDARVPVLAVDRRGQRADRRDHRPADGDARPRCGPPRRPTRRSTTTTSSRRQPPEQRRAVVVERGREPRAAPAARAAARRRSTRGCSSSCRTTSPPATWRRTARSRCRCGRTSRRARASCSGGSTREFPDRGPGSGAAASIVGGHNYGQGSLPRARRARPAAPGRAAPSPPAATPGSTGAT